MLDMLMIDIQNHFDTIDACGPASNSLAVMNDRLEAWPKSNITNEKPQDCRN